MSIFESKAVKVELNINVKLKRLLKILLIYFFFFLDFWPFVQNSRETLLKLLS